MPQIARPDADITDGAWTAEGGPTDLFDCLDEVTPSDTDFIEDAANNTTCELGLTTLTDPAVATGHILRCRMKGEGSGGPERVQIALFEGATQRAISGNFTNRGSFADKSYTLTTGEADSITAYTDLRIKLISSNLGGGETMQVSHAEFEVPDVGAGDQEELHATAICNG